MNQLLNKIATEINDILSSGLGLKHIDVGSIIFEEMELNKKCGIYKITSPSGKIYIGQSVNCEKRSKDYKMLRCKSQRKLYHSLKKYGWEAHVFEIIKECSIEELNTLEKYYVDLYKSFESKHGLNLKDGGGNVAKASKETLKLRSKSIRRAWVKRKKLGKVHLSLEALEKSKKNRKEAWKKQKANPLWNSPEEVKKRYLRAKNKKCHPRSKQAKENMCKGWNKYKKGSHYNSLEQKEKRRKINLGKTPWNKGLIGVMIPWNKGLKETEAQKKTKSDRAKKQWEEKRKSGKPFWSKETIEKRRQALIKYQATKHLNK